MTKVNIIILFTLCCQCAITGRGWHIIEINRQNKDECKEIIRERPRKNKQFKKVVYKIKKECRDEYRRRQKEKRK